MQQKSKSVFFAIITSLLVTCLAAHAQADLGGNSSPPSQIPGSTKATSDKVASVNGAAVSWDQFENAMAYQQEIASVRGITISNEQIPALKCQVIENLINQELLYQESQQYGIKIDEIEIDDAYEERKQKAAFKTDAEFEDALKKTNKSVASYREEIKKGLAIDRFVQKKFTDNTVVSDSEAKKYYDENPTYFEQPERVRVSHIMVGLSSDADQSQKDGARAKIETVLQRLKAGEDFASVAKEVSDDANSKSYGGDLGYIIKGQAPLSFENAAFALNKDEISDIVETGSGYHILKITDKKDAGTVSYEEAKNDIINSLKTGKVNSSVDNYINELKIKSTIVTYPISQ